MSIFPQLILNTTSKAEVKDQAKRIYLQWPIAADNIFTYLLYNINSTRHVAPVMIFKVYTGFLKKIINTLFSNATFVTQNQHSVTDASRTPRGCGFDVLECQKGWQLVIKVNWKFLRFSIAIGHLFTEIANQLALFLESHQFLLVFLANIFAALGVVGWNKKTKCCEFALAVSALTKCTETTVCDRGLRSKCKPDITAASTPPFLSKKETNSISPPPVFWSGFSWLERASQGFGRTREHDRFFSRQGIFLGLIWGNKGYLYH